MKHTLTQDNDVKVQLRPVSLQGWPGTMGGCIKRFHHSDGTTIDAKMSGAKVLRLGTDRSLIKRIAETNKWPKYRKWYNDVLYSMGVIEDKPEGYITTTTEKKDGNHVDEDTRENDISLLPTRDATTGPILRAFQATTRSDNLTSKHTISNPEIEMNSNPGLNLSYRCPKCQYSNTRDVGVDELIESASRDSECKFKTKGCPKCKENITDYIVTGGSRAIVNWYKVVITLDNDLDRILAFMDTKISDVDSWVGPDDDHSLSSVGGINVHYGNISQYILTEGFVDKLCHGLHVQYKYSMLGIIMGVSDPGASLDLPSNMTGFKNPVEHWVKKRHIMSSLWWSKIKAMLDRAPECENNDCIICSRYTGEDWHDVAPHISHCDVYGRLHAGTDIYSLSWVERMMVTASYWDELGNKDPIEVAKAKCSIGRACTDIALGRDGDFDQRLAKLRCLLNLNTYTLRRSLNEARYLANTGLGAFSVGKFEHVEQMIRGRLFEGMTLPYVEDDISRRSCSDCADIIVLAAQLGIVFHDAIDLPNDIFNGEYMNVYRMAASGGFDMLTKFTRGAYTLLKVLASTGSKSLCCGQVLQNALGNTVGWYFYCGRYNYASNVQLVCNTEYSWETVTDIEAACWVGRLLGCNEYTLELVRSWAHLELTSHEDWGCGNKNPIKRFKHMRSASFEGVICDLDTAEEESADIFCALSGSGRQHICGVKGKCLCCEITYECVEMSVLGDMVGRFVHHALRLGTGKIAMVIDN